MNGPEVRLTPAEREPVASRFEKLVKELTPGMAVGGIGAAGERTRDFAVSSTHGVEFFGDRFRHVRARRVVNPDDGNEAFIIELREKSPDETVPVWSFREEPSNPLQILRDNQLVVSLNSVEGDDPAHQDLVSFYSILTGQISERIDTGTLTDLCPEQ